MGVVQEHRAEIDGRTYVTTTLTATEGLAIMPRLMPLFSNNVASILFATSDEDRATVMEDKKILMSMIIDISRAAAAHEGLDVIKDLLIHTKCENVKVGDTDVDLPVGGDRFGEHFRGDYFHLLRVAWWVARKSFNAP